MAHSVIRDLIQIQTDIYPSYPIWLVDSTLYIDLTNGPICQWQSFTFEKSYLFFHMISNEDDFYMKTIVLDEIYIVSHHTSLSTQACVQALFSGLHHRFNEHHLVSCHTSWHSSPTFSSCIAYVLLSSNPSHILASALTFSSYGYLRTEGWSNGGCRRG